MSTFHSRRRLQFEGLEQRELMARDVMAVMSGHTLTITGTPRADTVFVGTNDQGQVVVTARDASLAATANTNGREWLTFDNVNSVIVSLGEGNDLLSLGNLDLAGAVKVTLGAGRDEFVLGDLASASRQPSTNVPGTFDGAVNIAKSLTVLGGAGDDDLELSDLAVGVSLVINAGAGSNRVSLSGSDNALEVRQAISIAAVGGGHNEILLNDVTSRVAIKVVTGGGADEVNVDGVTTKSLTIKTGAGHDSVAMANSTVTTVTLNGGAGENEFDDVSGNNFRKLLRSNIQPVV